MSEFEKRFILEMLLITYVVLSPFAFLWFHRRVLREQWDGDFADRVVLTLYVVSNVVAQLFMYLIQEGASK